MDGTGAVNFSSQFPGLTHKIEGGRIYFKHDGHENAPEVSFDKISGLAYSILSVIPIIGEIIKHKYVLIEVGKNKDLVAININSFAKHTHFGKDKNEHITRKSTEQILGTINDLFVHKKLYDQVGKLFPETGKEQLTKSLTTERALAKNVLFEQNLETYQIGEIGKGYFKQAHLVYHNQKLHVEYTNMEDPEREFLIKFGNQKGKASLQGLPQITTFQYFKNDWTSVTGVMVKYYPNTLGSIDVIKATPAVKREIMLQICQAIKHFHSQGCIHDDIKADNVVVNGKTSDPLKVKAAVIDFGQMKKFNSTTDRLDTLDLSKSRETRGMVEMFQQLIANDTNNPLKNLINTLHEQRGGNLDDIIKALENLEIPS